MSESKKELEESVNFYEKELKQLEGNLHDYVMNAYHTQIKIDDYKDELQKLNGELEELEK